jgi:hypothetical protein
MAEQLQKKLDGYLESLSNAKNVVDAWERRKLEIKREMYKLEAKSQYLFVSSIQDQAL